MTRKRTTRLLGHSLIREGWPFIDADLEASHPCGPGMAKCQCGAMSDLLLSTAARKRWHRRHKEDLRG